MGGESEEEGKPARVDEVMLLSCLFLIGPSGDGRHNNSFVEEGGGCGGRGEVLWWVWGG